MICLTYTELLFPIVALFVLLLGALAVRELFR